MKRFLLFMLAALAFAACTQNVVVDITPAPILDEAPETLVVDLEGDDTRIQLQNGKTVWNNGDLVSVFYRSDANQKWQYTGETGSRTAELTRVDEGVATETMKRVVVVYPYNENYYINTETYNVQASLPAVQSYLEDSYGLGGNIMISQSEYNQFSLKSVCGWLKLQLTGNGEKISSITLRGNNGEQVAGELYINSADATALLAADMGSADDNNAGGSLIFDDTILKEVTLDCGEGVTLGKSATAFYIALPPQTFENGLTIEVECDGYMPMIISTSNSITIERNHIQPMAPKEHNATPITPNNEIWYTSTDVVKPYKIDVFGATIISNEWDSETGKGIITFDGDVTTVGEDAFWGCDSLKSVTIGNSVTTIGDYAFHYCKSLTSVNIPDSVTTIGEDAFYGCKSLTSVTIGNSVTTIGNDAFLGCDSLTSVNIPDSVTTIGEGAFYSCSSLTSVNIPDNVTTIGNDAFLGCECLTSVTIGNSVTTIGYGAFMYCESLTSVNIPDNVTTIGKFAFSNCSSLTSVDIPESVTTIGEGAFAVCSYLREFTGKYAADGGRCLIIDNTIIAYAEASGTIYNIPDSVTTIGQSAFLGCESLTSVNIPDSVTTIGLSAFSSCTSLTSVNIPNSVTTIGNQAFWGCDSLKSVTIGNSVTTIGNYAFIFCTSLTSVNIPESATTIGNYAFMYCDSLKYVYCKATTPPALGDSNVFDYNASGRRIIVPIGSGEAYKTAENWSEYANDIFEDEF